MLVGMAIVAAVVVLAVTAWAVGRQGGSTDEPRRVPTVRPAEPTTAPPAPTVVETTPPTPPSADSTAPAENPAAAVGWGVAFRLAGTVYVARADGSGARPVGRFGEGPYALSPDGRRLAVIADGRLTIVELEQETRVDAGGAVGASAFMDECPAWLPDSRAILFVRGDEGDRRVRTALAESGRGRELTPGSSPSVSPDGRVVAVIDDGSGEGDGRILVSVEGGPFRGIRVAPGGVTGLAAGDDRVYVSVLNPKGESSIHSIRTDGRKARRLTGAPDEPARGAWGSLALSPDGERLAVMAVADDRISRVAVIDLGSERVTWVEGRRDTYFRRWGPAGRWLFLIEGNAYQGEPTALVRVARDGSQKRTLVTGAQ